MVYMRQNPSGQPAAEAGAKITTSCIGVRVARLNRLVARRFDAVLRPHGVTISQLEVLAALVSAAEPVRPAVLASGLAVERSTMSRNLASLERRGRVVTTERSPSGRSQRVAITQDGRSTLAEIQSTWARAQRDLLDALGADVVPQLDSWLRALT